MKAKKPKAKKSDWENMQKNCHSPTKWQDVAGETHTCLAASSSAPTIKSNRPSPSQSTIAGRPNPPGMPWNGLGSTSTKCLPDLNSKSESPSTCFFKITSKSPSPSQSTTMGSSDQKVLISSKTKNGFATATSRTNCLDCPRQPWRSLVSHHQPNAGNGNRRRRPNHFMALRLCLGLKILKQFSIV